MGLRKLSTVFICTFIACISSSNAGASCLNSYTISSNPFGPIAAVNGDCYTITSSAVAGDNLGTVIHLGTGGSNQTSTMSITNNGTIGSPSSTNTYPIDNGGFLTLVNNGSIVGTVGTTINSWAGLSVSNQAGGLISNTNGGVVVAINNTLWGYGTSSLSNGTVDNAGTISIVGGSNPAGNGAEGVANYGGGILSVTNSGSITGDSQSTGIYNGHSSVGSSLVNTGTISMGTGGFGIYNDSPAPWSNNGISFTTTPILTTITNKGAITAGTGGFGIVNLGTITTLNNLQGTGNSASPLTLAGNLPSNYNVIINNTNSYGQLKVTSGSLTMNNVNYGAVTINSGTGTTNFGIFSGSSVSNNTKYTAVLSGVTTSQITNKSGTYSGYSWTLGLESNSSDIWDLIISGYVDPIIVPIGPSVANTNQSLVNTASALQGTYTLQNSVLANSFSYDCTVFGANDVCISAGGRNTQVQAANGLNNTSALLIAAYRPHPNYRIGAYADQNLSVSNPGGAVNLGNNTPLIGLFAAWNERLDGTGTEVKVSAAYGQKNTTITRSVVGSGATASEAGSGSSTLNSQGTQLTAKYGFGILDNVIVSPYVGVRYTQNNMAGYTEGTSSTVTAPLTYSALNTNATTALAGVGASYRVIPQVMTFASAGVETDTNTANGTYSATNTSIGTLTPVNFNANPVKTRPTATVGAYYDIEKNQRVGITGIYRQEPYQAVSTTTVLATYTVGL